MNNNKLCLISFSNNADYQDIIYCMFDELKDKYEVYTIGIESPKCTFAPHTAKNYYYLCPLRPGITKGTFRIGEILKMAKMIKKEKITHLFFESQHLWNAFLMLLCPKQVKIVVVHDVIPHDGNKAMTLSNYVTSRMADYVVIHNKKYREDLCKRYKVNNNKIKYLEFWKNFPGEKKCGNSRVFLCFGRIRRYKGIQQLIDVIKLLPGIHFRIVGEPDEESMPLVDELKTLSNAEVCDREVTNEELQIEFENADWVLLPYSAATQSGVIMDAYRFSCPVIAFDVGAISEQIIDGETGYLVDAGNIAAFAKAIKKAAALNKEETETMAHNAYTYGYGKYSVNKRAEQFANLIYNLEN